MSTIESIPTKTSLRMPARFLIGENAPVLLIIALHGAAVLVVRGWIGFEGLAHPLYFKQWIPLYLVMCPILMIAGILFTIIHRTNDWRERRLLLQEATSADRLATFTSGLVLLMALMLFMGSFTTFKTMMPTLRGGFLHDRAQADWDAWLHFGHEPWTLLQGWLASDWGRQTIEFNYNVVWFLVCFLPLFWIAVSPRASAFRARYFACFTLSWIVIGNLLALAWISAGPAFYHHVTGDTERFAGLMTFIAGGEGSAHSAARFQEYLWSTYTRGEMAFGTGISAFPSMHVGLAALNAFFLFDYSRRLGAIAFAYLGLVLASSVYLGWHYAIDGYVSIVVVLALHIALKAIEGRPGRIKVS
ncbi:phosphatase PAP2 family protein [Rhizobium sp. EC-SD404]|uniref:phosphatase PAP2 family protein n=1 Tax=Rhizobium sp. EC-SD404 TaxID=2038389 RepID=UPI001255910C|nr:phosphatase PAP2 family protein [Rhizobium sp. EC-SD404]VVS99470.1 Membrane-associated phospholipid phosphatase [Rhizobium sp. EC-SD404]